MSSLIGGQAVLEGVMMRGPSNWSVAVRKPDGDIAQVSKPIVSPMTRHWALRLPVVRGVVALGESLAIGFRAGWFVIVEGLIRVTVFVVYLSVISLLPDLRRVFQYHAAEHKAINAYEAGEELEPARVQKFSLIHPRCGTAFLLWVMVIAIFVFAFFGRPAWYWLIATRILLLPVIAGIAYELIRFAGKHTGNRILMTLLAPGLWLQRLTTREPTLDQLEVSIRALREVLEREGRTATPDAQRVEVMA
ncbi:MAG: DUF1385 domain-containing protein [Actinobacteria bacterium]|nr:MAG: DUF1385 domain-containing protein [Actinomycetota bacterium]